MKSNQLKAVYEVLMRSMLIFAGFLQVIDAALKLRNLDHTSEIIQPLIDAVTNIKEALIMKGDH